eukprot:13568428-Heterocapsa_arctica.AAC.1
MEVKQQTPPKNPAPHQSSSGLDADSPATPSCLGYSPATPFANKMVHPQAKIPAPPPLPGCEWWQQLCWDSMLQQRVRRPAHPTRRMLHEQ